MSIMTLHVDAVLTVRDGYTGSPLPAGGLRWTLDGARCHPEAKRDGYFVFTGLAPGEHALTIQAGHFRDESLTLRVDGAACTELAVTLKPTERYPFGAAVTWLTLRVTKKGAPCDATVCLAAEDALRAVKLAQDAVEAGAAESRVFCRGPGAAGLPANYLLEDGKSSEMVILRELDGELGHFAAPLRSAHKRGRTLWRAQIFTAAAGELRAVFPRPVKLRLFAPDTGALAELELKAGMNEEEFRI